MSNRRAQDERIEGTPDGVNAITEIVDVPDAPTIGTATASIKSASVAFTPATTGGTVSTFTAISSPGSFTGTSATSPITVTGLAAGTSYSFTVSGTNSTGTSPESSSSNSVTVLDLPGSYDALADVTIPSGGAAYVTFAGIPSGYKHLQIRYINRNAAANDATLLNFNNDSTGSNYAKHQLRGNGSAASSVSQANIVPELPTTPYLGITSSVYGAVIVDILDYASSTKNKTLFSLGGYDANGSGQIWLTSGLWVNTEPITSIKIYPESGDILQHSSFALYGVK